MSSSKGRELNRVGLLPDETAMSFLDDMSNTNAETRRSELVRLLATGLIRVLLQAKVKPNEDFEKTSADGLDDS